MKFTLTQAWLSASWREADRERMDAVDVDHQYLGLLGVGGAAARLLGSRGITLASARTRVREALADDLAGLGLDSGALPDPLPFAATGTSTFKETGRAKAITDAASKAPDTYALLVTLLQEPSGTVRRLVNADGVAPQDLVAPLKEGSTDPFGAITVPAAPGILPAPSFAREVASYVSAPRAEAADALARPEALPYFSLFADAEVADDGVTATLRKGDKTMTVHAELSRDRTAGRDELTWTMRMRDGRAPGEPLNYHRLTLTDAPGGTDLTHQFGYRTFGTLGRLLHPITRLFAGGVGMQHQRYAVAAYISEAA